MPSEQLPSDDDGLRPRLLLVEDDAQLGPLLGSALTDEGYRVRLARDGHAGLHLALTQGAEVMVIDRGLPAIEGVELVRRLRARGVSVPVLLLTARGTASDRVEGLDAGAEDYLVKPFDLDELFARLRALLRRHRDDAASLPLGRRRLVVDQRRVVGDAVPDVELSPRECELLAVLARKPSRVFSRDDLLVLVFDDADTPGAVDTYVHYLRRKLGRNVVKTVRGTGYRMGSA
ncbi:MAG TPA: response regulator transcription factor [Actinomycetales bacterium]|nr:response regulator transcription factor [Actinomycetales bacterium]